MGAFSLKSVLLARHAQHVVLIHFPIALFLVGVFFDLMARWMRREALAAVAFYNVVVAGLFVVPVLITGVLAWRCQLEGQRLHGTLLLHLLLGSTTGLLVIATAWLYVRKRGVERPSRSHLVVLESITAMFIVATAHLGGILSGVNGPV